MNDFMIRAFMTGNGGWNMMIRSCIRRDEVKTDNSKLGNLHKIPKEQSGLNESSLLAR